MNPEKMDMPLSDRRYVTVSKRGAGKGQTINVREYEQYAVGGLLYPCKRGLFLTEDNWAEIMAIKDDVNETLQRVQDQGAKRPAQMVDGEPVLVGEEEKEEICSKWHVGSNVFIVVETGWPFVNLRRWWIPPDSEEEDTLVPTKRGLCLRPEEWKRLIGYNDKLETLIPDLVTALPHCLRKDHQNQLALELCSHCNPSVDPDKVY